MTNNKKERAWKRVAHFIWSHPRYIKSQWLFNNRPITRLYFDRYTSAEEVFDSKSELRAFCESNPEMKITFAYEQANKRLSLYTTSFGKLAEMFEQSPSGSYTLPGVKEGENWLSLRRMTNTWSVA